MSSSKSAAVTNVLHPMPPATADFATTWAFLEEGVHHIMTGLHTSISYYDYNSLYTVAYNYCTSSRRHNTTGGAAPGRRTGADLMGSELYDKLTGYFIVHLKHLRDRSDNLQDEALLQYYATEWDRYTTGANYLNRVFAFLNRHWVKRERDEGRRGVYPVYTLALVQWEEHFFLYIQSMHAKLTSAILRSIECERNGETIDQDLVKKVVDSFVSLGLDKNDINKVCFNVYKKHLQTPFLDATEKYYEQESGAFLVESSVLDYLKIIEKRLKDKEDRVASIVVATRRPDQPQDENEHRLPPGFFDDSPHHPHSAASHLPVPSSTLKYHAPGRTLLGRVFSSLRRTHDNIHDTLPRPGFSDWVRSPFPLMPRRRNDEGIEQQDRRPTVVDVPFTRGKRRNVSAAEVRFEREKARNKKKASAGSSRPPKSSVAQKSTEATHTQPTSSITPAVALLLELRHAGCWTRFWLFICSPSAQYTDGHH
ncbi:Cullin repeat-containing protein [Rhizopogon vinicolor AM-OR11-026]|uniref:Cullin repeat-containing protein n=1 Tax=Rhizopogon vinicolor AM-OR11-026 TaxID=1314800 RepID=A0A1B7NHQ6_9AGAM|nr:Cullin repeat-containing protein [Rhizopogon vinicolor AM-OR11-026]